MPSATSHSTILDNYRNPPLPSTHLEAVMGLTGWKKTSAAQPPFIGWWRTWNEQGRAERRWWSGSTWSIPCPVGAESDYGYKDVVTKREQDSIVWCGLRRPHLAGYFEYRLVKSPRFQHWGVIHHDVG